MDNWIQITTSTYQQEAYLIKNLLESNEIKVILEDEMIAQINPLYSNAVGGIKIIIPKIDYELGMKILLEGGYINKSDLEELKTIESFTIDRKVSEQSCPFCKSKNIGKKKILNPLSIILYFFLAFFPIFKKLDFCFDCNKEWRFVKTKV